MKKGLFWLIVYVFMIFLYGPVFAKEEPAGDSILIRTVGFISNDSQRYTDDTIAGQLGRIRATVKNISDKSINNFKYKIEIWEQKNSASTVIKEGVVASIAPGALYSCNVDNYFFPKKGQHIIKLVTSENDELPVIDRAPTQSSIHVGAAYDFYSYKIIIFPKGSKAPSAAVNLGSKCDIYFKLINNVSREVLGVKAQLFVDGKLIQEGNMNFPKEETIDFVVKNFEFSQPGRHKIKGVIDTDNVFSETDENNNIVEASVDVIAQ